MSTKAKNERVKMIVTTVRRKSDNKITAVFEIIKNNSASAYHSMIANSWIPICDSEHYLQREEINTILPQIAEFTSNYVPTVDLRVALEHGKPVYKTDERDQVPF